jgi:transcriptional regulator with XRE-family HTH domain
MPTIKPLTVTFPANLRNLRKRLGLSQEDFATLIEVAPSYVSMLERGQRVPALDMIDQIARKAQVAPLDLVK